MNIEIGKTYKNFAGNWRKVINIWEEYTKGYLVKYEDGTGLPRTCKIVTFEQWIKKTYY